VTKAIALAQLGALPPRVLWGGTVILEYAENLGAFMGMGASVSPALRSAFWIGAVSLVLGMTTFLAIRSRELGLGQIVCLSLTIGGGLGNLIDRFLHDGAVVDWVSVGIGPLRTGVFNVADVAVTGGCLVFVLITLRRDSGNDRT